MNKGYNVSIHPGENYNPTFFSEYKKTETDLEKANKVSSSMRIKISIRVYMMVYKACMHYDKDRANAVFAFLKKAYKEGPKILQMLGDPDVMRVMELSRKVSNETHLFKGVVRFDELRGGVLFGRIEPKCDVLLLLSHHFEERFPNEKFILYDKTRNKAVVHPAGKESVQVLDTNIEEQIKEMTKEDEYNELWRIFFENIGIDARYNPKCQRTLLPLWYRKNMTEFS